MKQKNINKNKPEVSLERIKSKLLLSFVILFSFYIQTPAQYQLQDAFPNLTFTNAVDFQNAGDGTDRIFIVEQAGVIRVFQNNPNATTTKVFLDITDRVSSGGEMGLLGLAFHPDYENNGYFYVNYTTSSPRNTKVSRFQVTSNPDSADKNTELNLMTISQPYSNHNGGQTSFGPDGYLYIAMGDGGSGGDPDNYGQNKAAWLGKILRIDVNSTQGVLNYAIPPTNPFAGNTQGFKEEIYAVGMRNPWRFSFDSETGWLWTGDVGQNAYEEIDVIELGKNYGWRCYEGNAPYNTAGCNEIYTSPIWVYPRSEGYSVTGGFVYRGPNVPGLYGKYIYADYGSRKVWSIEYDGINPAVNTLLLTASASPVSFGVDQNNELYVCAFSGSNDRIYKFMPTAAIVAPSNLQTTPVPPNSIQLTWNDNSNNELGFKIERKTSSTSFVLIDSVGANVTTYTNAGVNDTVQYTYRVFAYNSTDNSGYSNQASEIITSVPVELTSFTANAVQSSVVLKWRTASETNNRGFEIERFLNNNWAKIGYVEGNGTTTDGSSYEYVDDFGDNDFKGSVGYRLKQIDFDGTFSYSSELFVNLDLKKMDYTLEQNYPNPFNPSTSIRFNLPEESRIKLQILNVLGEVVTELFDGVKTSGRSEVVWNADQFSSGVYYAKLQAESVASERTFTQIIKMMYLK
ncbi:MAG: PQQ-dependent sugar dehydrogenase [Ignavibacteriales bacterium]|nr:MAG: PQQ-dependent sugar dehydrogenase [Ignavibacteriales bacterium]